MAYQMLKKGNRGPRKSKPRTRQPRFNFRDAAVADLYFWLRANHKEFCDEMKARVTAEENGDEHNICSRIATGVEQFLADENPLAGECDPFGEVLENWLYCLDYEQIAMAIYLDVARTPAPEIPEPV